MWPTSPATGPHHQHCLLGESGHTLATAADDSSVKLWDLRKLKNFKTLQLDNNFEVHLFSVTLLPALLQ